MVVRSTEYIATYYICYALVIIDKDAHNDVISDGYWSKGSYPKQLFALSRLNLLFLLLVSARNVPPIHCVIALHNLASRAVPRHKVGPLVKCKLQ